MRNALEPSHTEWTRRTISLLKIGGVWIVPMWPGTIVTRTGEDSVRITYGVLPHDSSDMLLLREHLSAAGFTIQGDESHG
jgi:hypothetical protein